MTLKTVQKMFAGRQEAHEARVANLVRVNRMQQLSKPDPLVRENIRGSYHDRNDSMDSNLRTQSLIAVPKESQKTSDGKLENRLST